jgi:glycosyltransferase involved in cell wall biosynthesis
VHVLSLVDYLNNVGGGAELSAELIVSGLTEREGIDRVTVVGIDRPDADRLEYPGVEVVSVSPPPLLDDGPDFLGDLLLDRRIAGAAAEYAAEADIVHAHHRRSTMALQHLTTDAPTVGTVRDFWPICPISIYYVDGEVCTGCDDNLDDCLAYQDWDGLTEPAIRKYLLTKRAHNRRVFAPDHAVFIAEHIREAVSAATETPPATVINNPVSFDREAGHERPDRPTFVVASTLSKEKGVDTAITAMERVHEQLPDAKLLVFGDGPMASSFRDLAAGLPEGVVEFRGHVPAAELYEEMRAATATIFPSRWNEPFGRVTVESMALGTPIVGSDVGGIAEVVDDGETGLLFPPGDADALAERLVRVASDTALWDDLSTAGPTAAERFSVEEIVAQHHELYRKLTGI